MGGICLFGQVVSDASVAESVGWFGSGNTPAVGFGNVGTTSNCGVGLVWRGCGIVFWKGNYVSGVPMVKRCEKAGYEV